MPIEFHCTQCQNVLKVGDEHAGKSARCPSCKAVTAIPLNSEPIANQPRPAAPPVKPMAANNPFANPHVKTSQPEFGADNPYRAPTSGIEKPLDKGGLIRPTPVTFDEVFNYAWDRWKNNLGILVGMTVIVIVISYGFGFGSGLVLLVMENVGVDGILLGLANGLFQIVSMVINLFLGIGQVRICLSLARQQPTEITQLFSGADRLLPYLGASILIGIAYVMGFVLLIVPGILLMLYTWPYAYLIADYKTGAMKSFEVAATFAGINKWTSFVLFLAGMAISFVGFVMCGVGLLFAIPLISMMMAVAYLKMSGQI